MKITFTKIYFKNFLSYGNVPTEVDLDSHNLTMIQGENGTGKSTIIDAIFFALTGKPYRNIKISQLLNDVNQRALEVGLEFTVNDNTKYKIIRKLEHHYNVGGDIEFYINGERQDENNSKRVLQDVVNNIVKINSNTLKNILILNANQSKSFIDLSPKETRRVIEDLFGISIYAQMFDVIKNRYSVKKDSLEVNNKDLGLYKEILTEYKENVGKMQKLKSDFEKNKAEQIVKINNDILDKQKNLEKLAKNYEICVKIEEKSAEINKKIEENKQKISTLKTTSKYTEKTLKELKSKLDTIESNICPVTGSECRAASEYKVKEEEKLNLSIKNEETQIEINKEERDKLEKDNIKLEEIHKNINSKIEHSSHYYSTEQEKIQIEITHLNENLNKVTNDKIEAHITNLIDKDKIKSYIDKCKTCEKTIDEINEDLKNYQYLKDILSDDGIKANIVKKDLPYLNAKIREYLTLFDFNVIIELNSLFELKIRPAIQRKVEKSYYSFSEGEKKRIDLSILFSFIDLARKKNSCAINLLILDELLDSSLDDEGILTVMNIIKQKSKEEGVNFFIISHQPTIKELSGDVRTLTVVREGQFSRIKES